MRTLRRVLAPHLLCDSTHKMWRNKTLQVHCVFQTKFCNMYNRFVLCACVQFDMLSLSCAFFCDAALQLRGAMPLPRAIGSLAANPWASGTPPPPSYNPTAGYSAPPPTSGYAASASHGGGASAPARQQQPPPVSGSAARPRAAGARAPGFLVCVAFVALGWAGRPG